jgi:hypothetical protein
MANFDPKNVLPMLMGQSKKHENIKKKTLLTKHGNKFFARILHGKFNGLGDKYSNRNDFD